MVEVAPGSRIKSYPDMKEMPKSFEHSKAVATIEIL